MGGLSSNSIRLFRVSGINVYLHYAWFLIAAIEIGTRSRAYSSYLWNVAEYLSLFLIVLMHEFGHALACRQVGGIADQIVLWPLGGVAYVNPPPRPGATLWSIAAGPLVNVALFPVFWGLYFASRSAGLPVTMPDLHMLLRTVLIIDVVLLVFNILPIYPLDGGQILRSLLWFVFGRARSLMIAAGIGFLGAAGFIYLAFRRGSTWDFIIAAFVAMNCWNGWKQARALSQIAQIPRRPGYACPVCHNAPPMGAFWKCQFCGTPFDTFISGAACPQCSARFDVTSCLDCGRPNPIAAWTATV